MHKYLLSRKYNSRETWPFTQSIVPIAISVYCVVHWIEVNNFPSQLNDQVIYLLLKPEK